MPDTYPSRRNLITNMTKPRTKKSVRHKPSDHKPIRHRRPQKLKPLPQQFPGISAADLIEAFAMNHPPPDPIETDVISDWLLSMSL